MNNTLKFIVSLALTLGVGFLGSIFTTPEIDGWYQTIRKPSWVPPNNLFGPVWTALYALMGISLFLVWKRQMVPGYRRSAFIAFFVQLFLNFCWSILFFRMHQISWAFIDIILLWVAILVCIFSFARTSKLAAWLLVPYISWVSFAALLNYSILQLN